jgi:hypothetical protein
MKRLTIRMLLSGTGAVVLAVAATVGCNSNTADSAGDKPPAAPTAESPATNDAATAQSPADDKADAQRVVIYVSNTESQTAILSMDYEYVGEVPGNDRVTVPTTIGEHVLSFKRGDISTSIRITVKRAWQTFSI